MAEESSGWDAIDVALAPIYGDTEPLHMGTLISYALGGPDPIHGISAYTNTKPKPHWHFVTYGFTELWEKESEDATTSGYGFELTFRLARKAKEKQPPNWVFNFLQNLGRYVFETGNVFGAGHTMPLNGPIAVGSPTLIHAISFAYDPELPPMVTPNGSVEFLQIVGLTMAELDAISSWNASEFLKLVANDNPYLLTDLNRKSYMNDKDFTAKVAKRTKKDGSSCGWLNIVLECDTASNPVRIEMQTIVVEAFKKRLMSRLPYDRELALYGDTARVLFKPGKQSRVKVDDNLTTITLREDQLAEWVTTLQPHSGVYPIPGLKKAVLEVVKTEITNQAGEVVEVVD